MTANCKASQFSQEILVDIYMRVFDIVKAAVNVAAFAWGIGYTVLIDAFRDPNGVCGPLICDARETAKLCTAYSPNVPEEFSQIIQIIANDKGLFQVFDDLIVSISTPHHSPVNCARAVEGIRHLISQASDPKNSWLALRDALKLSELFLKYITDTSIERRHGSHKRIEGDVTIEVIRRAWVALNRYLEYKKRGSQPLPEAEFPIL